LRCPSAVHRGRAPQIVAARHDTLLTAYARPPERFAYHAPQPVRVESIVRPRLSQYIQRPLRE